MAFSLADLTLILRECAGQDESVDLDGDILDTSFADLGYDSLALLEAVGRIERETACTFPDDGLAAAETPRQFLALVNQSALTGS